MLNSLKMISFALEAWERERKTEDNDSSVQALHSLYSGAESAAIYVQCSRIYSLFFVFSLARALSLSIS
jgi:hypothetical protein